MFLILSKYAKAFASTFLFFPPHNEDAKKTKKSF